MLYTMDEEKSMSGTEAVTDTANVEQAAPATTDQETNTGVVENTFTKAQVNEIIKNRLNKFYKRYGVMDSKGLDDLVAMSQSYKTMKELYSDIKLQHSQIADENAGLRRDMMFMNSNVDPNRYEEIISLFKGRELELNEDNFKKELALHNEWLKPAPNYQTFNVGAQPSANVPISNERAEMAKIFGLKNFVNK